MILITFYTMLCTKELLGMDHGVCMPQCNLDPRLSGSKGRGGPFGVTPAVKRTRILTREVAIIAFVHQHKPGLVLATS